MSSTSIFTFASLLDATTLPGQLLQAVLHTVAWHFIFQRIKSHLRRNYRTSPWYIQASSKGDGETELLMLIMTIPHHTVTAIFVWLAYYFDSLQLFTIGSLSEFALEFLETVSILTAKFVRNDCAYKPQMIACLMSHHLGGLLVIIPTNLYFGGNPRVQLMAFSLLVVAPIAAVFVVLYKTRNVHDLQQRGQFTVYMFCTILVLIVARFMWTPVLIVDFLQTDFVEISWRFQLMFIVYVVLINVFNISFVLILCQRLYQWLYGHGAKQGAGERRRNLQKLMKGELIREETPASMPRIRRGRSVPLDAEKSKKYN